MAERIPWNYTAEYYETCNCDYGCSCNFSGFPSKGSCKAVVAYSIRDGRHGSTDLAGASFVLAVAWPKAIHDGDGTAALFFDPSTKEEQMQAFGRILMGEDGGMPHEIIAGTISNVLGPFVEPCEIRWNGTDSSLRVGDKISSEMETFKNPVTQEPNEVHVVLPQGFIWQDANAANAKSIKVRVDGLSFTEQNTNAFHSVVTHSNS